MSITTWSSSVAASLFFVSASVVPTLAQAGPIHDAAKAGDVEQVRGLIEAGTDVNEKDTAFKTALHWAAEKGHMGVVQVLVDKGAGVNDKDLSDVTPLHLAVLGEHESILEFLIVNGGDVNLTDSQGITALDDATNRSYMGVVEILKRAGAKCGTNHHYSKNCKQASDSG